MKPVTRLFLIGAPVLVAVSVFFGGDGDDSEVLADHPPERAASAAPNPLASASDDEKAELEARIGKMPPGLAEPGKKEIASRIVASAEYSTLDWRSQYDVIEDMDDGNGYTAGVIGFCSGTNDMLQLVEEYTKDHPGNPLEPYLPALREVDGTDSHEGLDPGFPEAWEKAAEEPAFREAQDRTRDRVYFDPAVRLAKMDGLGTLGQFIYYDAMLLHGPGLEAGGFYGIRHAAMKQAKTAAEGGSEKKYLNAFLDRSRAVIRTKVTETQRDTSRIDTAQRVFLKEGNLDLKLPLRWKVYGEPFRLPAS
ncbi:chitosanase [Streptomyces sp. NBC_01498]|uniref:chitosanase n=1 Tax=Streptomyces sp. NBC_01498 TaxID=2975870 RepID=UPI002E7B92DC|nr:chitosanase [Streptomyces sp. NBC_01498]WTL23698.1 chitosanase [Streptomyces sp. NBC_01498]